MHPHKIGLRTETFFMRHVTRIQQLINNGEIGEAEEALENLLALGPKNLEALKIKARILEARGFFKDATREWEKVASLANSDLDAIDYFRRKYIEDRENFFYTDELADGGRRFIAYSRAMIQAALLGLLGCMIFVIALWLNSSQEQLASPWFLISLFVICVCLPWPFVMYAYLTSVKSVTVSGVGLSLATRTKTHDYRWNELSGIYVAHSGNLQLADLALILVPKEGVDKPVLEIGLNEATTSIRARSSLVQEVARQAAEPTYLEREKMPKFSQRRLRY